MASSKKTLDIDTLTFQTMYMKALPGSLISSYTIPMIPPVAQTNNAINPFVFVSPHQALSAANIYITPSTIPDISNSILSLQHSLNTIASGISSVSTLVSYTVSTTTYATSQYTSSIYETLYNSTYSTLVSKYNTVENQYNSTVGLYIKADTLDYQLSNLSTSYIGWFNSLTSTVEITYNQGPAVSTMSSYLGNYFNNLAVTIPTYSTVLGGSISTVTAQSQSTYYNYYILASNVMAAGAGKGISTISSMMGSSFVGYQTILTSYNPTGGISSISTLLASTLNSFSTLFYQNSGIPGICSLSTQISETNLYALLNLQQVAGISGICTMSTTLSTDISSLKGYLSSIITDETISSFSTTIYTSLNLINSQISKTAYVNTNLQQDAIAKSISTLSTSFGNSFTYMTSLSSYSSMLGTTYSTLSTLFSVQAGYSTLNTISTAQGSNISSLIYRISTTYPAVACGPGVSSLSTALGITVSSMSTSVGPAIQGLTSTVVSVTSSFTSTTTAFLQQYSTISTILYQNLVSPQFSTFYSGVVTTSSITANTIFASSIGIGAPASIAYPLTVQGGLQTMPASLPLISYVMVGQSIFTGSSPISGYTSTSLNKFTVQGNAVEYNGSVWVAVGSNINNTGNLIKYSTTPNIGWSNAIYPTTGVPSTMNALRWNGSYWLAGGSTGALLKSSDGANWSNATQYFEQISSFNGLAWNGSMWVGVGADPQVSSILHTDTTGTWRKGTNTFTGHGNGVTTNGHIWVAVGKGTTAIKYSYNGITWSDAIGDQLITGSAVAWNGDKFVAAGSNGNAPYVLYSFDGVSWSSGTVPTVTTQATSVLWDGSLWKISNLDGTHMTSVDGIRWSQSGLFTGPIYGQAYAANTIPTLQLPNFDIYSQETPAILNSRKRMTVIQSSIYFNDGGLTIRNVPSTISYVCVGINNTYPTVALDIGNGDARKLTGATWISPSDARVKSNIVTADLESCAKLVSEIPIRQYSFTNQFQEKTGVSSKTQYGFIAQEVKKVLPNSVFYSKEFGFDDFHSLDTDQLFKLEFGATQYLLTRLGQMELQLSTLEGGK